MPTPSLSRTAATLLEITVSLAVLGTVSTMVTESISIGTSMQEHVGTESDLVDRANRVVKGIAYQLRSADYDWITITEGAVSTYQFTLCTGLNSDGPVFNQGYTLSYDSVAGTLTSTLTDRINKTVLQQNVAKGLRRPNPGAGIEPGFQISQLGTAVVVTGNQLQLSISMEEPLTTGEVMTRTATTMVFLRSTMYANANLTRTVTPVTGGGAEEPPEDEGGAAAKPIVTMGDDTDKTTKQTGTGKDKVTLNNLLIKGALAMPTGTPATIDVTSFSLLADKLPTDVPQKADYTVKRGWVKAENSGNKLLENEFLLSGWVDGSLTVTVTVRATNGESTAVTRSY